MKCKPLLALQRHSLLFQYQDTKKIKPPKWLLSLEVLYLSSLEGKWLTNEIMAKRMPGGYYARNHLAENGEITKLGIKHEHRDIKPEKGNWYREYRISPESMALVKTVLEVHGILT